DADAQAVGRPLLRQASDVEGEGQVAAHVLAQVLPVEPDAGPIHRRPEPEADAPATPARVQLELGLVPGGPEVVAGVIEQVVPAARHGDLPRRGQAALEPAIAFPAV